MKSHLFTLPWISGSQRCCFCGCDIQVKLSCGFSGQVSAVNSRIERWMTMLTSESNHRLKSLVHAKCWHFNLNPRLKLTKVYDGVFYRSVIWFLEQRLRNLFNVCRLAPDPQECVGSQRIRLTMPGGAVERKYTWFSKAYTNWIRKLHLHCTAK